MTKEVDLDDPKPGPGDPDKSKQDLADAQKRSAALEAEVKDLRDESAKRRIATREAKEALEERNVEFAELQKQIDGKLPETEQKAKSLERQLAAEKRDTEKLKAGQTKLLGSYKNAQVDALAAPLVAESLAEPWREPATTLMKIKSRVDPETHEIYIPVDGQQMSLQEWLTVWMDAKGDDVKKPTQKERGSETPRTVKGVIKTKEKEPDQALPTNEHLKNVTEYLDEEGS